jgi:hypothetical protein
MATAMQPPRTPFDPEGYYARLGVDPWSGLDTITAAYRRKARVLHPDVPGTGDSNAFIALKLAYDVLRNADQRAAYDRKSRQNAMPEQEPGEIEPTPFPDMPAPPTRHPRLRDLPLAVWIGMAAVLTVGIVEAALHLMSPAPPAAHEAIPANARAVPPPAPGEAPRLDYGPAPVRLAGTPNYYIVPTANPAVLWRLDADRQALVPWGQLPPFSAVQAIRLLKQNGMVEVRVTEIANGFIDAGRLTPGDTAAAARAWCTYHAGLTPTNGEVLSRGPDGPANLTLLEGSARLTLDNRSGQPAVVKIRGPNGSVIASVFLDPGGEATLEKLPDEPVRLDYAVGEAWSRACRGFAAGMRARRLTNPVAAGALGRLSIPPNPDIAQADLSDQAFQQE